MYIVRSNVCASDGICACLCERDYVLKKDIVCVCKGKNMCMGEREREYV